MSTLGERIRRLRVERGWSQEDAARLMDVPTTLSTWRNWETDDGAPRLAAFWALTRLFGVSGESLWYGGES